MFKFTIFYWKLPILKCTTNPNPSVVGFFLFIAVLHTTKGLLGFQEIDLGHLTIGQLAAGSQPRYTGRSLDECLGIG
jgi:hypothetical protein